MTYSRHSQLTVSIVLALVLCRPFSLAFSVRHLHHHNSNCRQHQIQNNHGNLESIRTCCPLYTSSPAVVTIGDALFDCIATDDARGMTVEQMEAQGSWTALPGGAPANVATALCKLGTTSAFCGCVGADDDGNELQALMEDIGVDVTLMQRTTKAPTRRVMVTRSLQGDREFGGFYEARKAQDFADCFLDDTTIPSNDILSKAQWIVCSTLSLAFSQSSQSLRNLVQNALQTNGHSPRLYVDVNWRPVFWPNHDAEEARMQIYQFCQLATVVKMTDEEAAWLLPDIATADEALNNPARVLDEYFPKAVVVLVTAGEKGASYAFRMLESSSGNALEMGHIPPFQVPVVETTGAGDAFTAGFLHALLAGDGQDVLLHDSQPSSLSYAEKQQRVHSMVQFASAVGALTCTKEGAIAAQPTLEEAQAILKEQETNQKLIP